MAQAQVQAMYCYSCNESFADWDAYFLHKIQSQDHICCIFCGQEYKTVEGCRRHQHQAHSAEQDLACAGCGVRFVRVGSYINHIELKQCPVIHRSEFEARRALKREVYGKETGAEALSQAFVPTALSNLDNRKAIGNAKDNGAPLEFSEGTKKSEESKETSWEEWGDAVPAVVEEAFPALMKNEIFPALPLQQYRDGGSNLPDLLSGTTDRLNEKNLAWLTQKEQFPYLQTPVMATAQDIAKPDLPTSPEGEYHEFDPENPTFNVQVYYNPFTEKYRCPWPGCTKLQKTMKNFINHLKSSNHNDFRLRCPQCLRQFSTATALVQHSEAQGVSCDIRNSNEYRQAIDLLTAGFIDTDGRHKDETVRYIAPPATLDPASMVSDEMINKATAAFLARQNIHHEEKLTKINEGNQDW